MHRGLTLTLTLTLTLILSPLEVKYLMQEANQGGKEELHLTQAPSPRPGPWTLTLALAQPFPWPGGAPCGSAPCGAQEGHGGGPGGALA